MKNLLNLFAIALLLFATSCQKEEKIEITYPENPQNYVGEEHNQMVGDFLTAHGEELTAIQQPMEKEVFIFDNLLTENNLEFKYYLDATVLLGLEAGKTLPEYDFQQFDQIFKIAKMDNGLKTTLTNAMEKLVQIDGRTPEGLAKIQTQIREIEIDLMKDFEKAEGYTPAMTYLAVLKKSAQFWNGDGAGNTPQPTKAKWWQTLLADAAGAVIGGVLGGGTAVPLAAGFSLAVGK